MDCIFCKIAAGEIPAEKVYEDDHVLAFHDINPQAPLHVVIIPRRHIATINDIGEADTDLMGRLLQAAKAIAAREGVAGDGYRLVVNVNRGGGQVVFHIHMHLMAKRPFGWPAG
ncbi:histidine triad nucleotide-binding protein [Thioalbus denitrificans]|uniref:Histidine triad (HIT) family protein n=1 Tax=Thioalbus denitrificans TaxID=547122 RepID=A0A369BXJ6_9GAMM|nr:histidine triad nucleotide-binding protein [Thioalbus denitrificans]RCX26213.1 histidine triad (HIT) family protein [Thioalbus denitrificans]